MYLGGPTRGGSHVARLNFKASRVGVYKCFTSLSEIGERGIAMRCKETITVSRIEHIYIAIHN